jgi:hypothetical protein
MNCAREYLRVLDIFPKSKTQTKTRLNLTIPYKKIKLCVLFVDGYKCLNYEGQL